MDLIKINEIYSFPLNSQITIAGWVEFLEEIGLLS
ncbi:MAG: hypothetical protein CM15mP102_00030 [Flavobacteriales bacterium]|nr:MAG: hypothetical protein CM15mP102_00030 [Flavobacteriales bacterium]